MQLPLSVKLNTFTTLNSLQEKGEKVKEKTDEKQKTFFGGHA